MTDFLNHRGPRGQRPTKPQPPLTAEEEAVFQPFVNLCAGYEPARTAPESGPYAPPTGEQITASQHMLAGM